MAFILWQRRLLVATAILLAALRLAPGVHARLPSRTGAPVAVRVSAFSLAEKLANSTWWSCLEEVATHEPDCLRYAIEVDGKSGYIDRLGRIRIPPRFDHVEDCVFALRTLAEAGGRSVHLDPNGGELEWVLFLEPSSGRYERVAEIPARSTAAACGALPESQFAVISVSQGLALVRVNPPNLPALGPSGATTPVYGYVAEDGTFVIQPHYAQAGPFTEGLAAVRARAVSGLWGYIDRRGSMTIPAKFLDARPFTEGLAAVRSASGARLWGFIDRRGRFRVRPRFADCGSFDGGQAIVEAPGGRTGVIGRCGRYVVPPIYERVGPLTCGRRAVQVRQPRLWGVIDQAGRTVVAPTYDELMGYYPKGVALAKHRSMWHLIDVAGKDLTPERFGDLRPILFSSGDRFIAQAWPPRRDGGHLGVIDYAGRWLVKPIFDGIRGFPGPIALARKDGAWGWIDASGNFIWQAPYPPRHPVRPMREIRETL